VLNVICGSPEVIEPLMVALPFNSTASLDLMCTN
jgi:hypothetical protein